MHLTEVTDIIRRTRIWHKWKAKRHRKAWKGVKEDNSGKEGKVRECLESKFQKINLAFSHNEINIIVSPGLDETKHIILLYQWKNKTCWKKKL